MDAKPGIDLVKLFLHKCSLIRPQFPQRILPASYLDVFATQVECIRVGKEDITFSWSIMLILATWGIQRLHHQAQQVRRRVRVGALRRVGLLQGPQTTQRNQPQQSRANFHGLKWK